ncbi:MAG: hypothetical protein WAS49_13185 [Candidatus Dechloromonas phosphoritropha]
MISMHVPNRGRRGLVLPVDRMQSSLRSVSPIVHDAARWGVVSRFVAVDREKGTKMVAWLCCRFHNGGMVV